MVVGRLAELWLSDIATELGWNECLAQLHRATAGLTGRIVVCADYRALILLNPTVADALLVWLKQVSPRVERTAVLLPKNAPTLRLQVDRLVREARDPNHRICAEAAEVDAWLGPHLNEKERARLAQFLTSAD